jgi:hypothetical protein
MINFRSPIHLARLAGLCYLIVIITGLFSEVFVRQALFVQGDAVATAKNIIDHESLFRLGFTADMINFIVGLPCVVIFYWLFSKVNKTLALLAVFFVTIQTAIIALNLIHQLSPLLLLRGDAYLNVFTPEQLAAMSVYNLKLQSLGYGIGLSFFGVYCVIIGYLIYVSRLVPRLLAFLYIAAGVGYLLNSFVMFLSHGFDNPLFPYVLIPCFVGELSLTLWMLIKGVDENNVFLQSVHRSGPGF